MTAVAVAAARAPRLDHAREAGRRAIRVAAAVAIAGVAGFVFSDAVLAVLRAPIEQLAASRDASLNYDSVTGAFDLKLKIALFAGVVIASPVWLYESFAFLAPGLTRRERRYAFGFVGAALPLFAAGCAAGLMLFPHMVELLAGFASEADTTILQAASYVEFVMKIVLATGVAFVLPVVLVVLNFLGVLSARSIRRGWRVALVAIVVFSALVTPAADVVSMFLVALPMTALYGAAIIVAVVHDRAAERALSGVARGEMHACSE